jgi:uncharacterized protein YyaL (SSP411 family)
MNNLINETSPYLKQHCHNPVNWYPWGQQAFDLAKQKNCPIFLSIGYSTCYWCHVMEKDSFEKEEVAQVLNKSFVCIKVDREERPDVDAIYMDAVVAMTGHGGWPMSVFLTPDLKPFWGATFIPRDKFIQLASRISEVWSNSPDAIVNDSHQLLDALSHKTLPSESEFDPKQTLKRACDSLIKSFDQEFGGFGPAPKFPPSQQIMSLLLGDKIFLDERFSYAALMSLENIGKSALHDHVQGGFHRYATDRQWQVPHFEKMLYDNALLILAFLEGYKHCQHQAFFDIAKKTSDYLFSVLSNQNMFFAAEDAGDVGKEGEFYSWDFEEFNQLDTDCKNFLLDNFLVSSEGNFEHKNTLVCKSSKDSVSDLAKNLYKQLKIIRDKRARPAVDTKIIVSWNGLVLSALANLYKANNKNQLILDSARSLADNLINVVGPDSYLLHIKSNGIKQIEAMLEDYAYLIEGLISLYQSCFDDKYLVQAYRLAKEQAQRLWDPENKLFRSSTAPELINTKFEILDSATPSTNAVSFSNFKFLSVAFNDDLFYKIQSDLYSSLAVYAHKYPTGCLRFIRATFDYNTQIVAICSDSDFTEQINLILNITDSQNGRVAIFPYAYTSSNQCSIPIVSSKLDDKNSVHEKSKYYLCQNQTCSSAVFNLNALSELIAK